MNVANVCDRFVVLAEVESEELPRWTTLIEDACAYVQSRCLVSEPDEEQTRRLEALAAAYAWRLFSMCGDHQLSQFVAGDVRLTSSADPAQRADGFWKELLETNADLVRTSEFLFGRVM